MVCLSCNFPTVIDQDASLVSSFQNIVLRCPSVSSALGLGGQILGLLHDPIAVCRNGETLFFYLWCIFTEKLRRLVQTDRKKKLNLWPWSLTFGFSTSISRVTQHSLCIRVYGTKFELFKSFCSWVIMCSEATQMWAELRRLRELQLWP